MGCWHFEWFACCCSCIYATLHLLEVCLVLSHPLGLLRLYFALLAHRKRPFALLGAKIKVTHSWRGEVLF